MTTNYTLSSRQDAIGPLARLFESSAGQPVEIAVLEDCCFEREKWLSLGRLVLHPGTPEPGDDRGRPFETALRFGFFGWDCPTEDALRKGLEESFGLKGDDRKRAEDPIRRVLEQLCCLIGRVGLLNADFDPTTVEELPFLRPTTLVTDTSAILQGALDFAIRFLYPMARIKVPAIAQMELLNKSENYLRARRQAEIKPSQRPRALLDHMTSQGGQRVLLRLELQTDTEIERGTIGSDPLRGIVQNDPELGALGYKEVIKSFADRLIFETARDQQRHCSPDHPVRLMTGDQGQARMSMAEGIMPFYIQQRRYSDVSGRVLTGTRFDPFSGKLYWVSLTSLLWELATAFGYARVSLTSGATVEISAIGESRTWQPFHATDDLLWMRVGGPDLFGVAQLGSGPPQPPPSDATESAEGSAGNNEPETNDRLAREGESRPEDAHGEEAPVGVKRAGGPFYKFSPDSMLRYIEELTKRDRLRIEDALKLLGITHRRKYLDYRNFLLTGGFIEDIDGDDVRPREPLQELLTALRGVDVRSLAVLLLRIPSFAAFLEFVDKNSPSPTGPPNPVSDYALPNYIAMADLCARALNVSKEGIYSTPALPAVDAFAKFAMESYEKLAVAGERFVLTGAWLETLARDHGIHPVTARQRLDEARAAQLIERYVEGSTPETRFEQHAASVLEVYEGRPRIRRVKLYHGDFLIPGRSSVSLRIEKTNK